MFIAVNGYVSGKCHALLLNPDYSIYKELNWFTLEELAQYTLVSRSTPINFSIDRAGKVKTDCGDFSRFSNRGSAVVLAELRSKGGRTLGFKLLSCMNDAVANLTLEDILRREEAYGEEHFLQNGIIRNGGVACYPLKPFPVIEVGVRSKRQVQKVQNVVNEAARQREEQVQQSQPQPQHKAKEQKVKRPEPKKFDKSEYTDAQLREIMLSRKNLGTSKFIENPKLSPAQMRVLWVSKSKGALAEYYAKPEYSVDVMKFYADRLYSKEMVNDCGDMLEHPELSVDELVELYGCICYGVPYADLIGKPAVEIRVQRDMGRETLWGSEESFDRDNRVGVNSYIRKVKHGADS